MRMSTVFTEKQLQDGVFLKFLTGHAASELGWNKGVAGDVSFIVDAKGVERDWICRKDLRQFLQSPANASAWLAARRQCSSDDDLLDRFIGEALLPKLMASADSIALLRDGVVFAGQTFCLWAPAPRAGDPKGRKEAFESNVLRVVDELPFKRKFGAAMPVSRRPDLTFFVNGLYLSYAELKNGFTNQSASAGGRKKISRELVEAAERALRDARARHEAAGGTWAGWKSRSFAEEVRSEVRSAMCLYAKAAHILAADASKVFVLSDTEWILEEVDAAIGRADELSLLTDQIPENIHKAFSELPEIQGLSASETVLAHLASFFHAALGVDKEVFFFNQHRKSRTTTHGEVLRPRAAQRAMLYRTRARVEELYQSEFTPKVSELAIRTKLALEMPELGADLANEIVHKSLMHLNGKEAHSILLQGSTGLGKTNLIVWVAQDLADMVDPSRPGSMGLFDATICLTDRTELRRNLGDEADRLKSTRGAAKEAKTFADLKSALVDGQKIIVVNIQKFPSLMKEAEQDPAFGAMMARKRVAFVIDEAHRSQNGAYHESTMELFSDVKKIESGDKRNLVVCLTATPTDATLARFGEWRAPKCAGDDIRWVPFFSYPLWRAVKDGVVLNPLMNVQKYGDHIQVQAIQTVEVARGGQKIRAPSSEEIYENNARRKLIAEKAAKIFAVKTMMAIRPPNAGLLGQGKAMFVANSVKSAIAYQKHLKDALVALSKDPKFADRAEALAGCPVLILYSDKQGEPGCSSLNGGLSEEAVHDAFRRVGEHAKKDGLKIHNAIIVVVDKLLTGFDEPTLHTLFVDRGMDGVLLYQTASRVNRTAKWKNDCLIVDFSHDGCVSRNLAPVFEKYGGLTVSDFDAMPVLERMEEGYRAFFGATEIAPLFKKWQSERGADAAQAATRLGDAIDKLFKIAPEKAEAARKHGGAWRSSKDKLTGILDFALPELKKHDDEARRAFANMVVSRLRQSFVDEARAKSMVFDVDMVEASEGWSVDVAAFEEREDEDASPLGKTKKQAAPKKTTEEILAEDLLDLIEAFQEKEDGKLKLIENLKAFLEELFKLADQANAADNNGYHRKRVLKMLSGDEDYPWDERQKKFRELLNNAVAQPRFVKTPTFLAHKRMFWKAAFEKSDLLMADYEEWITTGK